MEDGFDVAVRAVGQMREALSAVKEDRERVSAVLAQERRDRDEHDRDRDALLERESELRATAERRVGKLVQELAAVRGELRDLSQGPARAEGAERERDALLADLAMSRREGKRLASEGASLRDRLTAAEAALSAASEREQQAVAQARHEARRGLERLQARVDGLLSQNAALTQQLAAAKQQSEQARAAMLDHAART